VAVFTKFDGQIINEYVNLLDVEIEDKWGKARENAEATFQTVYLPKVFKAQYPPKGYVRLQGEKNKSFSQIEIMLLNRHGFTRGELS